MRLIGLYGALLLWLVKQIVVRPRDLTYFRHPVALLLAAFSAAVVLSTLQAPQPLDSLNRFRKAFDDVLFMAPVVADVFRDPRKARLLLAAAGISGAAFALLDTAQYVMEWRELGRLPDNIHLHRFYADGLLFFLPFTMTLAALNRGGRAIVWWSLVAWQIVLLLGTGARGAWLAFAVSALVWLAFSFSSRTMAKLIVGAIVAGALAAGVVPSKLLGDRVRQGVDTSLRTSGTWAPTIKMIRDRPLLGYGFGKQVFHDEFNRRVTNSPHWTIRQSMGPHSSYLEIAFAAGIPALAVMLAFYWAMVTTAVRALRTDRAETDAAPLLLSALCAFIALYIVRGLLESQPLSAMGLLAGMAVAGSAHRIPKSFSKE